MIVRDSGRNRRCVRRRSRLRLAVKRFGEADQVISELEMEESKPVASLACDLSDQLFEAGELELETIVSEQAVRLLRQNVVAIRLTNGFRRHR